MRTLGTAAAIAMLIGAAPALAQEAGSTGAGSPSPAAGTKLSQAECESIWNKADSGKIGSLSSSQAQPYVTDFKAVDVNGDGKLSSSEFLSGCQQGLAHDSASSGAGSGDSGAASDSGGGAAGDSGAADAPAPAPSKDY